MPTIVETPSPNHDDRPAGAVIDMLVIHYTGMPSADAARTRLCDADARVSAHYLIDEEGGIERLVAEDRRAWHAGVSAWRGQRDVNARSIGIELVHPGHEWGYRAFTEAQMLALIELARDILARHPIPARNVVGHADVAPLRKQDPGELFDWARLAAAGVGLFPERSDLPAEMEADGWGLAGDLAAIGYDVARVPPGSPDWPQLILAFQRHFLPDRLTGTPDPVTCAHANCVRRAMEETR